MSEIIKGVRMGPKYSELINGEEVGVESFLLNHGRVYRNLLCLFSNFFKERTEEVFGHAGLKLTEKDIFMPELFVAGEDMEVKKRWVEGVPNFVAEILSAQTHFLDYGYKKDVYEACGVKEYWIVTIETRSVEVYLLEDGSFRLKAIYVQFNADDEDMNVVFSPSMFPEMVINLKDVFEDVT